jgi:hypothetical protein
VRGGRAHESSDLAAVPLDFATIVTASWYPDDTTRSWRSRGEGRNRLAILGDWLGRSSPAKPGGRLINATPT